MSRFNVTIMTDISRFYPTIYTHSIAWAIYGKSSAKSLYQQHKLKGTLADNLDKLARNAQRAQTMGLPIGPQTSRILAEIVAVGIENDIKRNVKNIELVRNVDDILIGVPTNMDPKSYFSKIIPSVKNFELDINFEKTKIMDSSFIYSGDWDVELREFKMTLSAVRQRNYIEHYFKRALQLHSENPEDNVLKYAINRSRSFMIHNNNWKYYESFLLRFSRINGSCIPGVCQILINERLAKRNLDNESISKFIHDTIEAHIESYHYEEIAWVLFLSKALRISIKRRINKKLEGIESGVCALLLMDINKRGLLDGNFNTNLWLKWLNADGFKSNMWLVAYEAPLKGWLIPKNKSYLNKGTHAGAMYSKKISFYDDSKNVRRTKIGNLWYKIEEERARYALRLFRSIGL